MPNATLDDLIERMHTIESELEQELDQLLDEKRQQFRYRLERGKVRFEKGMQTLQREYRVGVWQYLARARFGHILSAPLIYSVIVPFLLIDLAATLYQQVCFRIYGIPRVVRGDYIVIDRQHLSYLNAIEKLNCVYCGYGNGLIEYLREITGRTEQYWCPIKHARRTLDPHRRVSRFADYGDADNYRERLIALRKEIAELERR